MKARITFLIMTIVILFSNVGFAQTDKATLENMLWGKWQWNKTVGGFTGMMEYTPQSVGYDKTLIFTQKENGLYSEEYYDDSLANSGYVKLEYVKTIFGDSAWTCNGMVVRFWGEDALDLSDNHPDGFGSSYSRIKGNISELVYVQKIESECAGTGGDAGVKQSYSVSLEGSALRIDADLFFNCCSDKYLNVYQDGDVLTIKTIDSVSEEGSLCKCFCLYPVEAVITVDPFKSYTVVFETDYEETYKMQVNQSSSVCPECSSWIRFESLSMGSQSDPDIAYELDDETGVMTVTTVGFIDCKTDLIVQYKFWGADTLVVEKLSTYTDIPGMNCAATYARRAAEIKLPEEGAYTIIYHHNGAKFEQSQIVWKKPNITVSTSVSDDCYGMQLVGPVLENVKFEGGKLTGSMYFPGDDCNQKSLTYDVDKDVITLGVMATEMACENQCLNKADFIFEGLPRDKYAIVLPYNDTVWVENIVLDDGFDYQFTEKCDSTDLIEERVNVSVADGVLKLDAYKILNCCGEYNFTYTIVDDTLAFLLNHYGDKCYCPCINRITATVDDFTLKSFVVTLNGEEVFATCPALKIENMTVCKGDGISLGDEVSMTIYDDAGEPTGKFPYADLPIGIYKASAQQYCSDYNNESSETWFKISVVDCSKPIIKLDDDFYSLLLGDEKTISPTVVSLGNESLQAEDTVINWEIPDNKIIEYSVSGNLLNVKGIGEGEITAIAYLNTDSSVYEKVAIRVMKNLVVDAKINGKVTSGYVQCFVGDTLGLDVVVPAHFSMPLYADWKIVSGNGLVSYNEDLKMVVPLTKGEFVMLATTQIESLSTEQIRFRVFDTRPEVNKIDISENGLQLSLHFNMPIDSLAENIIDSILVTYGSDKMKAGSTIEILSVSVSPEDNTVLLIECKQAIKEQGTVSVEIASGSVYMANGSYSEEISVAQHSIASSISSQNKIKLYPVPVQDYLNIESLENLYQIKIYDLQGVSKSIKVDEKTVHLELSDLNSGMYQLELIFKDGSKQVIPFLKN